MPAADRYQVDTARDDAQSLLDVLQHIATREGHVQIVSVTWQPARPDRNGRNLIAGYTIISEREV